MPQVIDGPKELNELLESVYSSCIIQGGSEQYCSQISWTAAKNAGWKKDNEGKWVKEKSMNKGLGTDGKPNQGKPKTDEERLKEHFGADWKNHTVDELPPHGTGLGKKKKKKKKDKKYKKAVWTGAYINDLPDAAFAYIEPGGTKDDEGKTKPRALRHLPHHNMSVKNPNEKDSVDLPHLRNALARLPQTNLSDVAKAKARKHLKMHAKQHEIGEFAKNLDEAIEGVEKAINKFNESKFWEGVL